MANPILSPFTGELDQPAALPSGSGGGLVPFTGELDQQKSKGGQGGSVPENVVIGALRGAKDVIDTGAQWLATGFDKIAGTQEGQRVKQLNDAGKAEFHEGYGDSTAASIGRVGGQVAATLPVGGVLGAGAKMAGMGNLGAALSSGGMSAGAAGMGTRIAGGALTGGATAALVDADSAALGAGIGAALPPALAGAAKVGRVIGAAVAPFTKAGADRVVGKALNEFASDPIAAQAAMKNAPELVEGSLPTAAAASGDIGLAGVQRTFGSANPKMGAELAERATSQNEARTRALEAIAGNPGKIAEAKAARDAQTAAMREAALDSAGVLPSQPLMDGLASLLADPKNAGLYAKHALKSVQKQVAENVADGGIDARALYEIRKDIGNMMSGKLQGDAGNLKHAKSQLMNVQGMIDDAIEGAARRATIPNGGALVAEAGQQLVNGSGLGSAAPTWRNYLSTYSEMSKPIDQMQILDDVLKRVQTGAMDTRGNLKFSAAKLNNILKKEGHELSQKLNPDQLQVLRNVQADLNAATLAESAGKVAVGSNTAQNLAGTQFLEQALGKAVGGSSIAQATLGRAANWLSKGANETIENRLGEAMLDPSTAAFLMELSQRPDLLQRLGQSTGASSALKALPAAATGLQQ